MALSRPGNVAGSARSGSEQSIARPQSEIHDTKTDR